MSVCPDSFDLSLIKCMPVCLKSLILRGGGVAQGHKDEGPKSVYQADNWESHE